VKLLFDENLSPRLASVLSATWPGSTHIETIGMRGATDESIWLFARDNGFTVVSKDDDFRGLALVRGAPPQVIWLQVGNSSTSRVADLLRANAVVLETFSADPVESLIVLKG
jgi:predicted nuclease of predicted toxin-antitoxin system